MNWYLTKIVFQIICGNGNHIAQFDEQLRLISANDHTEAFYKAKQLGEREEDTFYNQNRQLVQWKFINVSTIYKLQELVDGAELYSRIEECDHADVHIQTIHKRAEQLLHSETSQYLHLI